MNSIRISHFLKPSFWSCGSLLALKDPVWGSTLPGDPRLLPRCHLGAGPTSISAPPWIEHKGPYSKSTATWLAELKWVTSWKAEPTLAALSKSLTHTTSQVGQQKHHETVCWQTLGMTTWEWRPCPLSLTKWKWGTSKRRDTQVISDQHGGLLCK